MIGYYVHHQGDGHRQRAVAIAQQSPEDFVLLGTGLAGRTEGIAYVDLADDAPGTAEIASAGTCLHYAPVLHEGIRQRVVAMTQFIAARRPALMVIDVSVEAAMLARLAATPTAYMRLCGRRDDAAHLQAFAAARAVIAPFHQALDDERMASWVRRKTHYLPGLTRAAPAALPDENVILFVNGAGGAVYDGDVIARAAVAMPHRQWRAIGPVSMPATVPENLQLRGWVANADAEIAGAGLVIGGGGDGVVNAVLAAGRRFICLPQPRHYDEQTAKAARLQALGAAVVIDRWPEPDGWPALIARAEMLDPGVAISLHDRDGLKHACDFLLSLAQRC